jgi:hypothetical protein
VKWQTPIQKVASTVQQSPAAAEYGQMQHVILNLTAEVPLSCFRITESWTRFEPDSTRLPAGQEAAVVTSTLLYMHLDLSSPRLGRRGATKHNPRASGQVKVDRGTTI